MKKFVKSIIIGLGATFILSGCGGSSSDNVSNNTTDTLTVKSVEIK